MSKHPELRLPSSCLLVQIFFSRSSWQGIDIVQSNSGNLPLSRSRHGFRLGAALLAAWKQVLLFWPFSACPERGWGCAVESSVLTACTPMGLSSAVNSSLQHSNFCGLQSELFFFELCCARHYNSGSHWAVLGLSLLDNGIKRKGQGRWKTKQTNPQTTTNRNHQSLTNRVKGETSSGSHGKLQSPALTTSSAGNSQMPMQCVVTL